MKSKLVRLTVTAMTAAVFLPLTILNPEPALASSFDLQGAPVLFANGPCDEDGEEAGVGFSHRYDNVVQFGDVSVDALVSLVSTGEAFDTRQKKASVSARTITVTEGRMSEYHTAWQLHFSFKKDAIGNR